MTAEVSTPLSPRYFFKRFVAVEPGNTPILLPAKSDKALIGESSFTSNASKGFCCVISLTEKTFSLPGDRSSAAKTGTAEAPVKQSSLPATISSTI